MYIHDSTQIYLELFILILKGAFSAMIVEGKLDFNLLII